MVARREEPAPLWCRGCDPATTRRPGMGKERLGATALLPPCPCSHPAGSSPSKPGEWSTSSAALLTKASRLPCSPTPFLLSTLRISQATKQP